MFLATTVDSGRISMKLYLLIIFVLLRLAYPSNNISESKLNEKTFTPSINSTFYTNRYKASSANSNMLLASNFTLRHKVSKKINISYQLYHNKSLENYRDGDLSDFRIKSRFLNKKLSSIFDLAIGADIRIALSDFRKDVLYENGSAMLGAYLNTKLGESSKFSVELGLEGRKYSHEFKTSFLGSSNQSFSLMFGPALNFSISKKWSAQASYLFLKPYTYNGVSKDTLGSFGLYLGYKLHKNISTYVGLANDSNLLNDLGQNQDLNKYFLTDKSLFYSGLTLSL